MSSNSPVLLCRSLSKSYTDGGVSVDVLSGLELSVAAREKVAILGVSGSGKTTLLNMLGGLDKPTSGEVLVQGKNLATLKESELDQLRNTQLGFVYQFHHLLKEFSAQENVAMPLLIRGMEKKTAMKHAADILSKVHLAQRMTHIPAQLSGGERQRVAIARAMVTQPVCVLMDEPTGNLDPHTGEAIQKLIHTLNEVGNTSFVLVTHDLSLASQMHRVLKLEQGKLQDVIKSEE
jgi:lipoprotein-releasing system ATP-binding protein